MNKDRYIKNGLEKVLNIHGYGFQYALLRLVHTLQNSREDYWHFVASEFPVEVKSASTRIDFILKNKNNHIYLICECKRVNPAYGSWVFLGSPHIHESYKFANILGEEIRMIGGFILTGLAIINSCPNLYHIGIEIKTNDKGDIKYSDKDAIEKTSSQVCRGMNGFVHFMNKEMQLISREREKTAVLIPVIFTTAEIFVSDIDIGTSDLHTGKVKLDDSKIERKPWIWYRYHQSPGIIHDLNTRKGLGEIGAILDAKYARSIAIVSSKGAEEFLTTDWWS